MMTPSQSFGLRLSDLTFKFLVKFVLACLVYNHKENFMKKLTALALSLATLGTGSAYANTSTAPSVELLIADASKPLSPAMRGEITTTIVSEHAANLLTNPIKGLPTPSSQVSDIEQVPTVLTTANKSGSLLIDTTLMDELHHRGLTKRSPLPTKLSKCHLRISCQAKCQAPIRLDRALCRCA